MNLTSRDSRGRPTSVSELTTFFEARAEQSKHQERSSKGVSDVESCPNNHRNEDINKLKDGHLVSDRRKIFENNCAINRKHDNTSDHPVDSTKLTFSHENLNEESISHAPEVIKRQPPEEKAHRSLEDIQNFRRSVMDTIIKYIQEGVSEDEENEVDDASSTPAMSETEVEECEAMMKQLSKSWTNLYVPSKENDPGDSENATNTEIAKCMEQVSGEFSDLVALAEREDIKEVKTRRSGNFVKSNRSSSRRKKMKKATDDVVYSYRYIDSDDSSKGESVTMDGEETALCDENSFASSPVYESDDSDDMFGTMAKINDFIVEAYNKQEKNVLYKLTLQREPILIPSSEEKHENSNTPEQSSEPTSPDIQIEVQVDSQHQDHQGNVAVYENVIVGNCLQNVDVTFEDTVEYINTNANLNGYTNPTYENVSIYDQVDDKQNNVYENWVVYDEITLEGSYYDKDLNPRITITCESNQSNDKDFLGVPKRIDSQLSSPTPKKHHIIDELRNTEKKYLDGLEYVIHEYLKHFTNHPAVRHIGVGIRQMFGNIEDIFRATEKFYLTLLDCGYSVECIAKLFLENGKLLLLCSDYMRNKSKTQHLYEQYNGALSDRQRQLNDKKTCDSYLLTPVQRPTRHKLLLENLCKDLKKHGEHSAVVEEAIAFIDKNISEVNRLLAIDSIRDYPIDLTNKGPLLLKDWFNIKRKNKYYVFLFRDVVVFTFENKLKQDTFDYKDSILSSDLSLKHATNSNTFVLLNFPKRKRDSAKFDDSTYNYELEATTAELCGKWVNEIRNILWVQLSTYRDLQNKGTLKAHRNPIQKLHHTPQIPERKKKHTSDPSRTSTFYIPNDSH